MWKLTIKVSGLGIWTRDVSNTILFPLPLDQGSRAQR